MREVAIIGAGELGGTIAHLLARRDIARSIRLVDANGSLAAGKALDISQAAPVEMFATRLSASTDPVTAAGAQVIVVADRAGGEWDGDEAVLLVKQIGGLRGSNVVLCAGAQHRALIERAVRELRLDRSRVFGSAPEALAAGARALVALAVNGSPRDVALSIVGVPPANAVVPWHDASIGGLSVATLLDEPARRQLARRIVALWPPGPRALAAAAVSAIEVMAGRSRRLLSTFVGAETSAGRALAMPVRLGAHGIQEVLTPSLTAAERVALENAAYIP